MPDKAKLEHIPVLAEEVLGLLAPQTGESYLDLTAGLGGHARLILDKTGAPESTTLVDRDPFAVSVLKKVFKKSQIIHRDFLGASEDLVRGRSQFDLILSDLGVSSVHLNDTSRGFSFSGEAPLDMRMDSSQKLTAEKVVNDYSEQKLAEIIKTYGEEPKAHQIAKGIVQNRPLTTTGQLATIAKQAWPGHSKSHPATRTFQALRMEVNGELEQLKSSLPLWLDLLRPGGRIAIISFHSLEDRIVKQFLSDNSGGYDGRLRLIGKKPVTAGETEIAFNPRARSAKLRAAVKIKKYPP